LRYDITMSGRSPALPRPAANNNTNNHLYNAADGNTGGSNSAAAGAGGGGGLLLDEESIRSAVMSDVMNRRAEIEARIQQQQQQQQSQSQQQQQSQRPSTTTTTTTKSQATTTTTTTTTTTKTRMNKNSSAVVLNTTRNQSLFDSLGDDDAGDANSASGVLSHLTTDDDAQSHASRLSTLSNNVSHILTTAKKILQGENPDDNHVIDEEGGGMGDDDEESEYNLNGGEILVPTSSNTDSMKIRGGRSKSVNVSVQDGNKHDNNKGANTMDDDDDDTEMYDFLLDATCEMTWGRRLGLALSNKTWYNPSLLHVIIAAAEVAEESNEKGLHDEALVDPNNVSSPVKSLLSRSFSSDEDDEDDISNGLLLGKSKSGSTTNSGSPTATIKRSKKAQAEWTRMQQEQRQKQMERAMLRNEAYPFTHSQKEQPSLAKAWACTYEKYIWVAAEMQREGLQQACFLKNATKVISHSRNSFFSIFPLFLFVKP
jgi:hypothetical protein